MVDIYTPDEGKCFYAAVNRYFEEGECPYIVTHLVEANIGQYTLENNGAVIIPVYDTSIVGTKRLDYENSTTENPIFLDVEFHYRAAHSTDEINVGTGDVCLTDAIKRATGTYTGNGQATRTIELDFTPAAVLVSRNDSVFVENGAITGGLAVTGSPCKNGTDNAVEITENGFIVKRVTSSVNTNQSTKVYNYIAIGE